MNTNDATPREADRAVPEPDAIERAAKAMYFTDANPDPVKYDRVSAWKEEWEKHLAFYQSEGYDPEGFFPAFMLAKKALAAVPTVQAAAGDDLDALLDSVHPRASMWTATDQTGGYVASVRLPKSDREWVTSTGTGATRMEAIKDAVANAQKEATQ